nr:hypothetical protein [Tanacetum cinerariifolium]
AQRGDLWWPDGYIQRCRGRSGGHRSEACALWLPHRGVLHRVGLLAGAFAVVPDRARDFGVILLDITHAAFDSGRRPSRACPR